MSRQPGDKKKELVVIDNNLEEVGIVIFSICFSIFSLTTLFGYTL